MDENDKKRQNNTAFSVIHQIMLYVTISFKLKSSEQPLLHCFEGREHTGDYVEQECRA